MYIINSSDLVEEREVIRGKSRPSYDEWCRVGEIDYLENEIVDSCPEIQDEWNDGNIQLIYRRDFSEYAKELAYELDMMPDTNQWPQYCIDWDYAARELAMDYDMVSFDGRDWYFHLVC